MMLKSMGIWKSTSEPTGQIAAMSIAEGEYRLVDGQLVPVEANGSTISAPTISRSLHNSRYIFFFTQKFVFGYY